MLSKSINIPRHFVTNLQEQKDFSPLATLVRGISEAHFQDKNKEYSSRAMIGLI
jgi:hypothetical protein